MEDEVLKIYKGILLKMLDFFDGFCTRNGLNYFASSGTAIGAVRHKGMIPWDDDIDIYMLRKDYDKLLSLRDELTSEGYAISAFGDKDCIYPFIKIYDPNTTLIEERYASRCRLGVFIDVFALDEVSGSAETVRRQKERYRELYRDFFISFRYPDIGNIVEWLRKKYFRTLAISLLPPFAKRMIRNRFISYDRQWAREKGENLYFHGCLFDVEKELFPKEWFEGYHYVPFDGGRIRVNDNVHEYLSMLYGDYMTPPPPQKRFPDHRHYYLNLKEGLSAVEAIKRVKEGKTIEY